MNTTVRTRDSTDPWEPEHGRVWRVVRAEAPPTLVPGDGDQPLLAYAEEVREVFGSILALAQRSRDSKGEWEYLIPGRARGGHLLPADVAAVRQRVDAQFKRLRGFLEEIVNTPVDGSCSEAYLDFLGLLVQVHLPDRPEHWHVTDEGLTLSNWGLEQGIPIFPATVEVAHASLQRLTLCWNKVCSRLKALEAEAQSSEKHWNRHVIPAASLPTEFSGTPAKDQLRKHGVNPATVVHPKNEDPVTPQQQRPPRHDESRRDHGVSEGSSDAGHPGRRPSHEATMPPSRTLPKELAIHLVAAILAVAVAALVLWSLQLLPGQDVRESGSSDNEQTVQGQDDTGEESPGRDGPSEKRQTASRHEQQSRAGSGSRPRLLPASRPTPDVLVALLRESGPGIDRAVHVFDEPSSSTSKDLA